MWVSVDVGDAAQSGRNDIYKILLVVEVSFLDYIFFSFKQTLMEQMT